MDTGTRAARRSRFGNNRGFSLFELLLVSALIPFVSFVIYSNFSAGTRLWKALQRPSASEDVQIFFQKCSLDFERVFKYASVPFEGDIKEVAFAGLITTDSKLGGDRAVGQTRYYYDDAHGFILRETKNISQLSQDKPGVVQAMLRSVESFEVRYFILDPGDKSFKWVDSYDSQTKTLPVAVKFHLGLSESGRKKFFTRTFVVPVGNA